MAVIALVGSDAALLEGLAQLLASIGHRVVHASTPGEATERLAGMPPLVAVMERSLGIEALRLPLSAGGARVLYRLGGVATALPAALQRAVLADLALPLERTRLVKLIDSVEERARLAGRDSGPHAVMERAAG